VHTPIIAHSAWSPSQCKEAALLAGMVDYLEKPVSKELMKATIEKFILLQERESDRKTRAIPEQNKIKAVRIS